MLLARVFPRRTNATPDDELAFTSPPPKKLTYISEVHVSVAFTYDLPKAEQLAEQWGKNGVTVRMGGPAMNEPGGDFVPGRYLKKGYVITSRGCLNRCWFCSVPKPLSDLLPDNIKQKESEGFTMEYYGIWAVRGTSSVLGRAEAWSKRDGVPEVFTSKGEANRQTERYNEGYSPNVRYFVKEMEPELAGSALRQLNAACAQAIDKAVRESHYDTYHYDLKGAAEKVIGEYGTGRVNHVLANIILTHEYDGRYSGANKAWAREFDIVPDNRLYCDTHPHVLDGFIDRVREITAEREKEAFPDKVHGYEVKQAVCFTNDRGFALAHNPNAPSPFVTWQFTDENGKKDMYWGHYFSEGEPAASDYDKRVSGYKADYVLEEKYNYLAATEMSAEQNYNMIDGRVNNEAARRADLTDGQTHDEIAELAPETLPDTGRSDERPSVTEKLKAAKESVKGSPGRPSHEKKPSGLERG